MLGRSRPGELGTLETLRRSSFARIMFMDIGAVDTLGALYLLLSGRTPLRLPGGARQPVRRKLRAHSGAGLRGLGHAEGRENPCGRENHPGAVTAYSPRIF